MSGNFPPDQRVRCLAGWSKMRSASACSARARTGASRSSSSTPPMTRWPIPPSCSSLPRIPFIPSPSSLRPSAPFITPASACETPHRRQMRVYERNRSPAGFACGRCFLFRPFSDIPAAQGSPTDASVRSTKSWTVIGTTNTNAARTSTASMAGLGSVSVTGTQRPTLCVSSASRKAG